MPNNEIPKPHNCDGKISRLNNMQFRKKVESKAFSAPNEQAEDARGGERTSEMMR